MKVKLSMIMLLLLLIAVPPTLTRRIKKKRRIIETATLLGVGLVFFIALKGIQAWNLHKAGKKAEEQALEIAEKVENQNAMTNRIIDMCRNAHKIYDLKMTQFLKMERIFIKIKGFKVTHGHKCSEAIEVEESKGEDLFKKMDDLTQQLSAQNTNTKTREKKLEPEEFDQKTKKVLENNLICLAFSVQTQIRTIIEQLTKFATQDVKNICSADILPYLSESFRSIQSKMSFIEETEKVLRNSTNFIYRIFSVKAYENISGLLNFGDFSSESIKKVKENLEKVGKIKKFKAIAWKDVGIGLLYGLTEMTRIGLSIDHIAGDWIDAFMKGGISASIDLVKNFSRYQQHKNNKQLEKRDSNKINVQATHEMPSHFDGIKEIGVMRILYEMIEQVYVLCNTVSYSAKVDAQLGFGLSEHKWERDRYTRFTDMKQYEMLYSFKKFEILVDTFEKATEGIQLSENEYERMKKEKKDDIFSSEHFNSFQTLLLKKEFMPLSAKEIDIMNKGKYYNKLKIAYEFGEMTSYLKYGFVMIKKYNMLENGKHQVKDEIRVEQRYYKEADSENSKLSNSPKRHYQRMTTENQAFFSKTEKDKKQNKTVYILAKRTEANNEGSVLLYYKMFPTKEISQTFTSSYTNLAQFLERNMRNDIKGEMQDYFKNQCGDLKTPFKIIDLVNSAKFKLKITYDYYLGYLKIKRKIYERPEYAEYVKCFNDLNLTPYLAIKLKKENTTTEYEPEKERTILLDLISHEDQANCGDLSEFEQENKHLTLINSNKLSFEETNFLFGGCCYRSKGDIRAFRYESSNLTIKADQIVTGQDLASFLDEFYANKIELKTDFNQEEYADLLKKGKDKGYKIRYTHNNENKINRIKVDFTMFNLKKFKDLNLVLNQDKDVVILKDLLQVLFGLDLISKPEKNKTVKAACKKINISDHSNIFNYSNEKQTCTIFNKVFEYQTNSDSPIPKSTNESNFEIIEGELSFKTDKYLILPDLTSTGNMVLKTHEAKEQFFSLSSLFPNFFLNRNSTDLFGEEELPNYISTWHNNFPEQSEKLGSCKFALLSQKIKFVNAGSNLKFTIYPSKYDIEIKAEENNGEEVRVKPEIVVLYTILDKEEKLANANSAYFENKFYSLGFIKLKNSLEDNANEFKISIGYRQYFRVSFWLQIDEEKYRDMKEDLDKMQNDYKDEFEKFKESNKQGTSLKPNDNSQAHP